MGNSSHSGTYTPVPRDGHRLSTLKGSEIPSNLCFLSVAGTPIETDPLGRRIRRTICNWSLRHVTLANGKRKSCVDYSGQTPAQLWQCITDRQIAHRVLWVFGYDLSTALTLGDFWGALENDTFTVGPIAPGPGEHRVKGSKPWKGTFCVERSPVFASVMSAVGRVQFTDILNYCDVGLEEIAESLDSGPPRQPPSDATADEWEVYNDGIVSMLDRFMVGLLLAWKRADAGPWGKTVAALALNSYRRWCHSKEARKLARPIITARHQEAETLETQAYYGGRVDPLFLGRVGGSFFQLDVSSFYPHAMASGTFPRSRKGILRNPTPRELLRKIAFDGASATVDIVSEADVYPVQLDGVLAFATGSFTTALCGAELRHALESGHVAKVHEAVLYDCCPLFAAWVKKWYGVKLEASLRGAQGFAERQVAKMVLNALYGKFAQHGRYWKTMPGGKLHGANYGAWLEVNRHFEVTECRAIAGVRQQRVHGDPPRHYFPAISAFVTAQAREHLRRLLKLCPERSLYYVGVDSLIVDQDGMDALSSAGEVADGVLGKLEIRKTANEIEIVSPNWYRFGGVWVRSGGWGSATSADQKHWFYEATDRLPSILARRPDGTVCTRTHPLGEHVRWAKGRVDPSGWVSPYTLHGYRSQKLKPESPGAEN